MSIRKCRVCGKEYEVCPACKRTNGWNNLTDTEDHYRILIALMDYKSDGNADMAREWLELCDVDFRDTTGYLPSVAKLIEEIGGKEDEPVEPENNFFVPNIIATLSD